MASTRKPKKATERRAEDQDGAVEVAFMEGVLPEEDRRRHSYQWLRIGNGDLVLFCNDQRCHQVPPEDVEFVEALKLTAEQA